MTYADVLSGEVYINVNPKITTSEGSVLGEESVSHKIIKNLTDGSGSNAATGFFSSSLTVTTGGVTISLANADPFGAAGDDAPTMSAEGLKLKCILFENQDTTNYVSVKKGTLGEASVFSGGTDSVVITAGGFVLWYSPAGVSAMNDGVDDEFLLTANTSSCVCRITYVFG